MKHYRFTALLPFFVFLMIFILLNVFYGETGTNVNDNFPIFAAFIAIVFSFFTFHRKESLNEKIDVFIKGSSQPIVLHMCYIFLFSTVFTHVLERIGSLDSAVSISLTLIPSWCILPGMFMIASLFSFMVGTSMGAIAAFMPITINIANQLNFNPSLMTATIICGAMFGDNLSILSDTTIAAVKVTKTNMRKKFLLNLKIAIPAFIGTIALLFMQNSFIVGSLNAYQSPAITNIDFIRMLPYASAFYCALIGIDILAVLLIGIIFAINVGLIQGSFTIIEIISVIFDGFYASKSMVNVFILVLFLSGLSKIISYNGGIDYLLNVLDKQIRTKKHAKIVTLLLILLVNITIAINTISIIVTGAIASRIGNEYNIDSAETACILDIGSCITQGILPYSPQILLAASMAHVSALSLLPYLYYQYLLAISLISAVLLAKK